MSKRINRLIELTDIVPLNSAVELRSSCTGNLSIAEFIEG